MKRTLSCSEIFEWWKYFKDSHTPVADVPGCGGSQPTVVMTALAFQGMPGNI